MGFAERLPLSYVVYAIRARQRHADARKSRTCFRPTKGKESFMLPTALPVRTTGRPCRGTSTHETASSTAGWRELPKRWSGAGEHRSWTMRLIVGASVVAMCALTGSAAVAEQRPALCKLVVNGKTYINGRCNFEDFGDGSFAIGVLGDDQPIPAGGFYFAYVDVHGNTAEA